MMILWTLAAALTSVAWPAWRAEVRFEERTELVGVVHALAQPASRETRFEFNGSRYAREARRRFKGFRDHPAVTAYREGFSGDPSNLLTFALASRWREDEGFDLTGDPRCASGSPAKGLCRLFARMNAFARDSGFFGFAREQRPAYEAFRRSVERELAGRDPTASFEAYTGLPMRVRGVIHVCPLLVGLSSHRPESVEGEWQVVTFWGPHAVVRGDIEFGFRQREPAFWHEIAHGALDGLADSHAAEIAALAPAEGNDPDCYGSWERCARETLVQGLSNRMAAWEKAAGRGDGDLRPLYGERPLRRIRRVEERLEEFEKLRQEHPTILSFYPRLLEALSER